MYKKAKPYARVEAEKEKIKKDMVICYQIGNNNSGTESGHVIYIENVEGDTVYYTEGGSGYYDNGTCGKLKSATRQGIMDGVNINGEVIGNGVVGFIDMKKY